MYTEGDPKPWHICAKHFSQQRKAPKAKPKTHFWIYALKLSEEKYYVGLTSKKRPEDRIRQHGGIWGARWTLKHKPVEVLEVKGIWASSWTEAERAEHELTMQYVEKYGHDNVRGGALVYSGSYTKFLNRYFRDYEWENFVGAVVTIVVLVGIIFFLAAKDYF